MSIETITVILFGVFIVTMVALFVCRVGEPSRRYDQMDAQRDSQFGPGEG